MPELSYAKAVRAALHAEMERDPSVVLIGEDIGAHGGIFGATQGLLAAFGKERVRDTPISESGFLGMAVGAAMTGLRPVVEIMFADFLTVCADPLVNQAAKLHYMTGGQVKVPLVVRAPQGSGRGSAAQHSQSVDALFANVPGLKIALPATPADVLGLLPAAIRDDNPVLVLEHKMLYATVGPVPERPQPMPVGVAEVKRRGEHVTVVALSRSVGPALQAAESLTADGISVEVIDPRWLRPFDFDAVVSSVQRTNHLVLVHEAPRFGSILAEIAATVAERAFDFLDAPIQRVSGTDAPVPFSQPLETAQLPDAAKIEAAVRAALA